MSVHTMKYTTTFGDCDPAGIVFYPNAYAWFDRTFHDWLRIHGGHQKICMELGALGVGVMRAEADFRLPMRDGNMLTLVLEVQAWGQKTLDLAYTGSVGGNVTVTGQERRGLFKQSDNAIIASNMDSLRAIIEQND